MNYLHLSFGYFHLFDQKLLQTKAQSYVHITAENLSTWMIQKRDKKDKYWLTSIGEDSTFTYFSKSTNLSK